MHEAYFQKIEEELQRGTIEKGHPFRFFSLATKALQDTIGLRTVVLRKVSDDLTLTFYTDKRSSKIKEIEADNTITALFYHPVKKIQLKISGTAQIESDSHVLDAFWKTIPDYSQKDYSTSKAPGSHLENTESISYLNNENHFAMVHIVSENIEFLKLGKPHHTRILFSKEKTGWKSQSLVP